VALMVTAYVFDRCCVRHPREWNPDHVAITGAGSGIGAGLATALARPGRHFTLADVSAEGLARVKATVEAAGATAQVAVVDVTDREATRAWITAADEARAIDLVRAEQEVTV
jgi:NADP-dependent 3-hydroxy acid dehydrogenase YdfG